MKWGGGGADGDAKSQIFCLSENDEYCNKDSPVHVAETEHLLPDKAVSSLGTMC